MNSDHAVVLDAATDEVERTEMEAVLADLTRLELIFAWHRRADGTYYVEASPHAVKQLKMLGWPQERLDAKLISRKRQ